MQWLPKFCISVFVMAVAVSPAYARVQTSVIHYQVGDTRLTGYLAYDDRINGKRPGVLIVHEWWGPNDFVRDRARKIAELGYVAFAVDMYGEGKTAKHPQDAGRFAGTVRNNMPVMIGRFNAAITQLKADQHTDTGRIAAIGYGFGGAVVLEMARTGLDIAGVVSFHGNLGTGQPAKKGKVKARVLVFNGAEDPYTKPADIAGFKQEMTAAGVDYELVKLPRARHAFTDPGATALGKKFKLPLAYSASADKASWGAMQAFFTKIFR